MTYVWAGLGFYTKIKKVIKPLYQALAVAAKSDEVEYNLQI